MNKLLVTSFLFLVTACTSKDSYVGGGGAVASQHLARELKAIASSGHGGQSSQGGSGGSRGYDPTVDHCYACHDPQDQVPHDDVEMVCTQNFYSESEQMCLNPNMSMCEVSDAGFSVGGGGSRTSY